jgi:hypothetical protein
MNLLFDDTTATEITWCLMKFMDDFKRGTTGRRGKEDIRPYSDILLEG